MSYSRLNRIFSGGKMGNENGFDRDDFLSLVEVFRILKRWRDEALETQKNDNSDESCLMLQ